MRFVLLNYENNEDFERHLGDGNDEFWGAWRAYNKALVDAGVLVGGNPLQPSSVATTVRTRDGRPQVQDGPYAETKEQLGGYLILEVPSLDEAIRWAARSPVTANGAVEVRPLLTTLDDRCQAAPHPEAEFSQ